MIQNANTYLVRKSYIFKQFQTIEIRFEIKQFRAEISKFCTQFQSGRLLGMSKLCCFGKSCSFIFTLDPKACCYNCNGEEGMVPCVVKATNVCKSISMTMGIIVSGKKLLYCISFNNIGALRFM